VGGGDGFGGRETEAGALAKPFGGEERLENVRDNFLGDAGAGVGQLEHDMRGGLRADGGAGDLGVIDAQGDGATVLHGVTGVDHEVEQKGGEFVAVADDGDVSARVDGFECGFVLDCEHRKRRIILYNKAWWMRGIRHECVGISL
jgi:hypothetical protein